MKKLNFFSTRLFLFMKNLEIPKNYDRNNWLQVGLRMFAESTGWIAIPVVGALFLGRWLDNKYDTYPLFFLGVTMMAFVISSIGLGVTGVKYIKMMEKIEKSKEKEIKK